MRSQAESEARKAADAPTEVVYVREVRKPLVYAGAVGETRELPGHVARRLIKERYVVLPEDYERPEAAAVDEPAPVLLVDGLPEAVGPGPTEAAAMAMAADDLPEDAADDLPED